MNDHIGLDTISVDVSLNKHTHCDKCYHGNTETTHYFFCSEVCFKEYIAANGVFEFNRYK